MKRNIFVLLLLSFTCILTYSQNAQGSIRSFAEDGKAWEMQVGGIKENVYDYYVDGDTLIDGLTWKKVYSSMGYGKMHSSYFAAVRDEGKKVYAMAKGSEKRRLLYDFNMKVGDEVMCGVESNSFLCLSGEGESPDTLMGFACNHSLRVTRIDTVENCGKAHRRFMLTPLDAYGESLSLLGGEIVWVEGVGSGAGPFSSWLPLPSNRGMVMNCKVNRMIVLGYDAFFKDEVVNAIHRICEKMHESSTVYDAEGRVVKTSTKGVRIKDGIKRLTR